jgi:single-stranded-DNA-specific exonuclease
MLSKRWLVAPKAPPDLLELYSDVSPVLAQVLYNRGFTHPEVAHCFLYSEFASTDPFMMKGMSKAVGRLRQAIKKKEQIIVYGDFDADGVTATTLLVQVLKALKAEVKPYIPHRIDEGYGLNSDALLKLARAGVKVVVTVDCGIRSTLEVEDGNAAGLDMIVTDHHSIGPEIPNAYAVINPKQEDCKYPEDMLAGVGIAYKLAEALLKASAANDRSFQPGLSADDLLDLVAIGTVADLAPMNRLENRVLVQRGLELMNEAPRPGLRALLEVAGIAFGKATAESIGFALGPRINAAGRLESAMIAYHLLTSDSYDEALPLAQELQGLNVRRQDITRAAQETVRGRLVESQTTDLPLIFASDASFQPGIVGLVAGRLTEEFYRPAVVMEEGELESRASCRSIPQFDITQALDQCADLLVRHGGHAQAAGFTVLNKNIPALKDRLLEIARRELDGQELRPTLDVDAEVEANQLTTELVAELKKLEPTGHMNPAPVLATRNLRVLEWKLVGKEEQHLKLRIARTNQPPLDAIGFNLGKWGAQMPDRIDVAYFLEINEWNGNRTLQLNLQDLRPAEKGQ